MDDHQSDSDNSEGEGGHPLPTRELLANRMNELDSLLDMNEFREINYHLESIFHILFNREKIVDNVPLTMYLDRSEQVELARICIRVIVSNP